MTTENPETKIEANVGEFIEKNMNHVLIFLLKNAPFVVGRVSQRYEALITVNVYSIAGSNSVNGSSLTIHMDDIVSWGIAEGAAATR